MTPYNTSAYDSPESMELMDGVVDIYMPAFKLCSAERSRHYLAKRDYAEVARHSVREMHRQVGDLVTDAHGMARRGLLVRHLVMPGLLDETEASLRFVATELGPGTYVNLMGQYYPAAGHVGPVITRSPGTAPSRSHRYLGQVSTRVGAAGVGSEGSNVRAQEQPRARPSVAR